jgi:hypothetical protein
MTEPLPDGSRVTQRDLYEALAEFRKENKEDMADLKKEVLAALAGVSTEFREYREGHAAHHVEMARQEAADLAERQAAVVAKAVALAKHDAYFSIVKWVRTNWKIIALLIGFVLAWVTLDSDLPQHLHLLLTAL